jgi:hypothetical protein
MPIAIVTERWERSTLKRNKLSTLNIKAAGKLAKVKFKHQRGFGACGNGFYVSNDIGMADNFPTVFHNSL